MLIISVKCWFWCLKWFKINLNWSSTYVWLQHGHSLSKILHFEPFERANIWHYFPHCKSRTLHYWDCNKILTLFPISLPLPFFSPSSSLSPLLFFYFYFFTRGARAPNAPPVSAPVRGWAKFIFERSKVINP